jgi:zinc transport system substrate-binding protein
MFKFLFHSFKCLVFLLCIVTIRTAFADNPTIIVSVAPDKFFVEKISGDTLDVFLMVPAGASAHTYEPSPRQMMKASQADIWFTIGESFEKRAIQALQSHRPNLKLVNLQQGVNLIRSDHAHGHKGCCPGSVDLHFWLSAREAQVQAKTISNTLSTAYPQNADLYQKNLEKFLIELKNLDHQIEEILAPLKQRNVLVGHPAYAYFCRDYQLSQYSIEMEGKDPTPQQMTKLLNLVHNLKIHTIFVQPQYGNKAAQLISKEIHAKLVTLDPYSENYLNTMLEIAHAFAAQ